MKELKTLKINSQTTQFAWDNHVLYLQADDFNNGKRKYYIRDVLEPYTDVSDKSADVVKNKSTSNYSPSISIDLPISGKLELKYTSKSLESVDVDKKIIDRNIEFMKCVRHIIEYIEEIDKKKL